MAKGGNKGWQQKSGGNSGRRGGGYRIQGGRKGGGPGKNAQHGDGSNHSRTPKGNRG